MERLRLDLHLLLDPGLAIVDKDELKVDHGTPLPRNHCQIITNASIRVDVLILDVKSVFID